MGGRPGSKDHWDKDAAVWAEWGVDWVKMDWCNTNGMEPKSTYPLMSAALNKTGRHIHFNMCEWGKDNPWEWGNAVANSWRATGDHTGTWASTKSIVGQISKIPAQYTGRPYGWNDMDMLETGNYAQAAHANGREGNMTATEYKTEFSMWAISASPLVVTTPITNCTAHGSSVQCVPAITDLQREILLNTEVIAINQDVTPQGRVVDPSGKDLSVWARHLSDGSVAVALYNEDDEAKPIGFTMSSLGLPASNSGGQSMSVRDLWAHADEPDLPADGKYGPVQVEAHATKVLRLTPKKSAS